MGPPIYKSSLRLCDFQNHGVSPPTDRHIPIATNMGLPTILLDSSSNTSYAFNMDNARPTTAELEAALDEDDLAIEIQPDGSIMTVKGKPQHAKPRILTLQQALDGTY